MTDFEFADLLGVILCGFVALLIIGYGGIAMGWW